MQLWWTHVTALSETWKFLLTPISRLIWQIVQVKADWKCAVNFRQCSLKALIMQLWRESGGQEELKISHRLLHGHVKWAHQRPPLFQHLLCGWFWEISARIHTKKHFILWSAVADIWPQASCTDMTTLKLCDVPFKCHGKLYTVQVGLGDISHAYKLVSDLRLCVLNAAPSENRWWRFTTNQGTGFTDEMRKHIAWDIYRPVLSTSNLLLTG